MMDRHTFNSSLLKEQWTHWVSFLLIATVFVLPISTSLKSIFIPLSIASILLSARYRHDLWRVFSQPWALAGIVLFLVIVAACFWSHANIHTRWMFVGKYAKLLFLPIFTIGFQRRTVRMMAIYAFLASMVITLVWSFLKVPDDSIGKVFHNSIATAYMMAFAAYLSGLLGIHQIGHRRRLVFLTLALLFSYYVIFVGTGRTGYVLYFVLMIVLLAQTLPTKKLIIGLLCFCVVFGFVSYQSSVLSKRMSQVVQDFRAYQQGNIKTSVGYRFMFHDYAKTLFLDSPWWGQGTGGFSVAFHRDNTIQEWNDLLDPHSQYWLIASELGILGLLALFVFFVTLFQAARGLHEMKPIMLGMLVAFILANVSDSLLLYSSIGSFFIVFCALCLGEGLERDAAKFVEKSLSYEPS